MNIVVKKSNGLVQMYGDAVPEYDTQACDLFPLSDNQFSQFLLAANQPNSGITFIDGVFSALPPLPAPIPQTASSGDFMKALIELDWYDTVDAAVQQADKLSQVLWNRAAIFERYNPMVIAIATAIGKTSEDLDNLFVLANSYN